MKKFWYGFTICFSLLCFCIAGCTFAGKNSVTPTAEPYTTPSATRSILSHPVFTITAMPTETVLATRTSTPTAIAQTIRISTPTFIQIRFPEVTMSPQEVEAGLLELLRTNGNCTDKCIGGIRPDIMTVQDAVDTMAQWGMISIGENSKGEIFINLDQNILYERVGVYLSVGTWTKEFETIDQVSLRIQGFFDPYSYSVDEDLWRKNRDEWRGFRLDNILKAYGIPSFAGYFFQTTDDRLTSLEGRTIIYDMYMQYEQINLEVGMGALAFYDGENLFLCPSTDLFNLGIVINPEHSLEKIQESPTVSWQALTGADLKTFYQMFTDEANPDVCVTTTLRQIQALQPDFH